MARVQLSQRGLTTAAGLIRAGRVDLESPWSLSADEENAMLGEQGDKWVRFGSMHLGVRPGAGKATKEGYAYPFGKLVDGKATVFRSALIAIRQRAAQQGLNSLYRSAGTLIDSLDNGAEGKLDASFIGTIFVAEAVSE